MTSHHPVDLQVYNKGTSRGRNSALTDGMFCLALYACLWSICECRSNNQTQITFSQTGGFPKRLLCVGYKGRMTERKEVANIMTANHKYINIWKVLHDC